MLHSIKDRLNYGTKSWKNQVPLVWFNVRNAAQVVQITASGEKFKRGDDMSKVLSISIQIDVLENGSVVFDVETGLITDVGDSKTLDTKYRDAKFSVDIDATGKCILPGNVAS